MRRTSTWKHAERRVANLLDGDRVGPSGTSTADVVTPWAAVEVKHRRRLPAWLLNAVDQARQAANELQIPLAVLHQEGQRYDDCIVAMRMADFIEFYGDPQGNDPA